MKKSGFYKIALIALGCGTLFQTASCGNPLVDEIVRRQITNLFTDSLFFSLDNLFVRAFGV